MVLREYRESDREILKELTVEAFRPVSIDNNIERKFGLINGTDWAWRKKRHIDADCDANPDGIFVAEVEDRVVGYITTRLDPATKIGWIPNMAVGAGQRGRGIGKLLMDRALAYFADEGMEYAKIETLDQNEVGCRFYPKVGFEEVARQIHYLKKL